MTDPADLLTQQRRIAAARAGLRRMAPVLREVQGLAPAEAWCHLRDAIHLITDAQMSLSEAWRIIRDERRRRREAER